VHEGWNYMRFDDDEQPKYRFYRFSGAKKGSCIINEIKFNGIETMETEDDDISCTADLFLAGVKSTDLTYSVDYKKSLTPLISEVSPKYGTVVGGTTLTIKGTGFPTDPSKAKVTIDGFDCVVGKVITATELTCVTGKRPGLPKESFNVFFTDQGLASNAGNGFKYVSVWSDDTTWGNEFAPLEMESIYIPPGMNLYMDIDKTPELNAVIVEGSLIFEPDSDPMHQRSFDARYIFIRNGTM